MSQSIFAYSFGSEHSKYNVILKIFFFIFKLGDPLPLADATIPLLFPDALKSILKLIPGFRACLNNMRHANMKTLK